MAQFSPIPNTRQRKKIYAASEAVRGTAQASDYKWYGELIVNKVKPTSRRTLYDGTYNSGPVLFGPADVDGTYSTPLSYQQLANLLRYGVAGGVAGVSDGETTPGYLYEYSPTPAVDDLESATLFYNFDGIPFRSTGVMLNEFTIRANIDDGAGAAWMLDSRLYVRSKDLVVALSERALTAVSGGAGSPHVLTPAGGGLTIDALIGQYGMVMSGPGAGQPFLVADNDATTITLDRDLDTDPTTASTIAITDEFPTGISDDVLDDIAAGGTELYVGDEGDDMDARQIFNRFKSFSATFQQAISPKRVMELAGEYSPKIDRGARLATAQITMEFDEFREVLRFEEEAIRKVRISQPNGPVIDATATPDPTRMLAYIDFPALKWTRFDESVQANNILVTYQGEAEVDAVEAYDYLIGVKTADAALP